MGLDVSLDPEAPRSSRLAEPLARRVLSMLPAGARQAAQLDRHAPVLGRLGSLEVRLARSKAEIRAAQHLRYHVFYEEMSAKPSPIQKMTRRDADPFDRICDHLLVLDRDRAGSDADQIVGTYRLLRQDAVKAGGFYTAGEFEIDTLVLRHSGLRFLELGRSCVLPEYRGKRTVELLWQGIWAYVVKHRIDVLFGCASLAGTDVDRLGGVLSFLKESAPAPDEWRVRAVESRRGPQRTHAPAIDPKRALGALPPLLKGYLRLGGYVGEDPVVDHQFGTTDVLIVLPVSRINPRYIHHFGAEAGRFAA